MKDTSTPSCLEEALGYTFKDPAHLLTALTHPSYCLEYKDKPHYQRLEFLGDAILGAALSSALYELFPDEREGKLAKMRSILASGSTLAHIAQELNLQKYIRMSQAEYAQNGASRLSSLEDCLEALVGAIYLDSGSFELISQLIYKLYGDIRSRLQASIASHNPKGRLQEWCQEKYSKNMLSYRLLRSEGPPHQQRFYVEVWDQDRCLGKGEGLSKKEAEEAAAKAALEALPLL